MSDLLTRFNFGELMGFFVVGGGMLIALVAIWGGMWTDVRTAQIAAALKQDMLSPRDVGRRNPHGRRRGDQALRSRCGIERVVLQLNPSTVEPISPGGRLVPRLVVPLWGMLFHRSGQRREDLVEVVGLAFDPLEVWVPPAPW